MKDFEIKTQKYEVGDINLNVATVGKGEPIVMIHGWSNSWIGWTLLAKELAPHYSLYMIDLPGFGDSDQLPSYSLEKINDYLAIFINTYVPNPRAIIGASAGTFVTVHVAMANNFNTSLVLIGTVLHRKRTAIIKRIYSKIMSMSSDSEIAHRTFERIIKNKYSAYFLEKYIHAYRFNKELVDLYLMPGRKKVRGKSYIQLGVAIMSYVLEEELKNLPQKCLLLFGSADKYVPPKTAEAFLQKSKNDNLSLSVIKDAGHNVAYEQPEKTADAILQFLNQNRAFDSSKSTSTLV